MSEIITHKDVTIGNLPAYHSYPDDGEKHPGLIVIHEIWGLDDHIKDVANRFAAEGYSVLAPNLFHDVSFASKINPGLFDEMNNPATRDEAQKKMRELFAPMQSPEFAQDMVVKLKKCVDYLLADEHVDGQIGVLGFCFGGTYSFALATNDSRIKAAAPYYGHPPKSEDIPGIACPILAFYGDQDANLMQSLPQLREDMQKNRKQFEAVVYPNAGHAFFNDTNARMYNPRAAQDAWGKTLTFLSKNLRN